MTPDNLANPIAMRVIVNIRNELEALLNSQAHYFNSEETIRFGAITRTLDDISAPSAGTSPTNSSSIACSTDEEADTIETIGQLPPFADLYIAGKHF